MAGYSAIKVQEAVHDVLKNDATLLAMLGTADANSILDNAAMAEDLQFPIAVYDALESAEFGSQTENGAETTITISAYSRSGDKQEAAEIIARIHTLLHRASLTVDGNDFIMCQWDGLSTVVVDDTEEFLTFRGIIRFKILTT